MPSFPRKLLRLHGLEREHDIDELLRTGHLRAAGESLPQRRTSLPHIVPWEELARGE